MVRTSAIAAIMPAACRILSSRTDLRLIGLDGPQGLFPARLIACACLIGALAASPSVAQDSASAEVQLTLDVENSVALRRVSNRLRFEEGANNTFVASEPFCVTASLGSFALSVAGSGPGGAFVLSDNDDRLAPYTVSYVDEFGDGDPVVLTSGQAATGFTAPTRCRGSDTGRLDFTIDAEDIPGGGRYTGSATILISGE